MSNPTSQRFSRRADASETVSAMAPYYPGLPSGGNPTHPHGSIAVDRNGTPGQLSNVAIDFMVMPFSRYVSGDFITSAMRAAWEAGVPYTILSPDGRTEYPPDMPYGGLDAPKRRQEYLSLVLDDLGELPAPVVQQLWDETSDAEPCFHRVDPGAYDELLKQAASRPPARSLASRLRGRPAPASHLRAGTFLPCTFEAPFDMLAPVTAVAGSVDVALAQLEATTWTGAAETAASVLLDALGDAKRLRLPMVVDW
jgi:hypothetical protein